MIDKNRDRDRITVLKYCSNLYASHCGLDDRQKVHFYVSLVNFVRKFAEGSFGKVRKGFQSPLFFKAPTP